MSEPKQKLVLLSSIQPADYNPRTISADEMEKLERSIEEFGFVEPVVVRQDGLLIGGHQRLVALRSLLGKRGLSEEKIEAYKVPAMVVDLDDDRAKLLNLALNKIQGGWDYDKLADLFREMESDLDVALSGFAEGEVEDLLALMTPPIADAALVDDPDLDADIARAGQRFSFSLESAEEADLVRRALVACGMSRPSEASTAFVRAMRMALESIGTR